MRAGVVVPAHNEGEGIVPTLEALLAQAWEGLDVLVVNDGSTDGTEAVVGRFPAVRQIVQRPNEGLARSISNGLAALEARGAEIGLVLHADCVPQGTQWVRAMLAPFSDPRVGAVVSARRLASAPKGTERFFDAVAPQDYPNLEGKDREIAFFRDKCDAYRLSALKELGGFDTRAFYVAGEDTDLSIRMRAKGYRILQSGTAQVVIGFSSHQRGLKRVFRKALQYGGAQAVLWRRHRYDGLKARAYAAGLLALAALAASPFPWISWPLLVPALAMLATTPVAVPALGEVPWVLAALPAGILLQGLGASPAASWSAGACAAVLALALRQALKAGLRLRRHGEGLPGVLQGTAVAAVWWLLTGSGYWRDWCRPRSR